MISFVLKRIDLKESDQIITLFTAEKGKLEALSKGVKKITSKNSAYLEPFFLIEAEVIEGKEVKHLTKAVPIESFKNIRDDINKSFLAGYVCEILNIFLPVGAPEKKIFDLLFGFLNYLENSKEAGRVLAVSFLWKVLCLQGYLPVLKKCVICEEKNNLDYFSSLNGGCVCSNCKNKAGLLNKTISLTKEDKQNLKLLITGVWVELKIGGKELKKQEEILVDFCAYHSQKNVPVLNFLVN